MRKRVTMLLFLCFCHSLILYAEEEKDSVELEPIVITPLRTEELAANVSRNISIITADDIKKTNAKFVHELIGKKAGVVVSEQLGNTKGTVVDIRGFGEASLSNFLVLVDGRRTNQIDMSGADWAQIDTDSVERIEIVRGPGSILYGDNATGGVINIITKKGMSKKPELGLSSKVGSYQFSKESGTIGGAHKFIDYFLNYSYQQTNGYRANNDYLANDIFGHFTLRPTDELAVDLASGYHHDHYGMPGALYINGNPSAITPRGINQIGRRGTVYPDDRGQTDDIYYSAEPILKIEDPKSDVDLSCFGSFRSRRSRGLDVPELTIWIPTRSEYETIHYIKSYELKPKIDLDMNFLDSRITNKLTAGSDFFYATDKVLSGDRLVSQDDVKVVKRSLSGYLRDSMIMYEALLLNGGIRIERLDYTFDQKKAITNYDKKSLEEEAYEAGAGYKYNKESQVYINFNKAYRSPNTEEYYQNAFYNTWTGAIAGGLNRTLVSQVSDNLEIGIKDHTFNFLTLNGDYFWMKTKNEIYFDPDYAVYKNVNYDSKTIRKGFETEVSASFFSDRLKPSASYTFQKLYFSGGKYANKIIPFTPKDKLSCTVAIQPLKGLDWLTSLDYIGSRFKISDQKNQVPRLKRYATVDTGLYYKIDGLSIFGSIKNIFNKKYYDYGVTNSPGTAETFYPAPERNYEAGITLVY